MSLEDSDQAAAAVLSRENWSQRRAASASLRLLGAQHQDRLSDFSPPSIHRSPLSRVSATPRPARLRRPCRLRARAHREPFASMGWAGLRARASFSWLASRPTPCTVETPLAPPLTASKRAESGDSLSRGPRSRVQPAASSRRARKCEGRTGALDLLPGN
jgi:hypothetical protein